ncbi:MAG TPA: extracellular solute-binding protein [Anaerolineae bacterium]|nr:extracellular solute-binding protein [Anaerolineae bacterium]HQI85278.1 extracellular solute-binding protein [Anaerolineae bacterium]
MDTKSHFAFALTILLLLLTCLPACAPSTSTPLPTPDPVTRITFLADVRTWNHYRQLAETFNARQSAIHVTVLNPDEAAPKRFPQSPEERLAKLAAAADVFLSDALDPATLAAGRAVQDLRPFLQVDADFAPTDVYTGLLPLMQSAGGVWGVPVAVRPWLIFYNPQIFDAAGIPYPHPGWSVDEFLTAAQALTRADAGVWGFAEAEAYQSVEAFALQNGGAWVNEQGLPMYTDAGLSAAVQWYAELATVYGVMPGPDADDAPGKGGQRLAQLDRAAMWAGMPGALLDADTGIAPFPRGLRELALVEVEAAYISAGSPNPAAAWAWIAFLTRQPPSGGRLPVRPSVYMADAYRSALPPETEAVYRYVLEHLAPTARRYPWFRASWAGFVAEGLPAFMRGETGLSIALETALNVALTAQGLPPVAVSTPVPLTPPPPTQPGVITLKSRLMDVLWLKDDPQAQRLLQQYYAKHPNVEVNFVTIGIEGNETLAEIAASADVVPVYPGYAPLSDTYFLDLTALMAADDTLDVEDFYPVALEAYRHQGKQWGLPGTVDATLLFYNRDLFDAAGVPYPQAGWTWEDLLAAAQKLSHGEPPQRQWGLVTLNVGWYTLPLLLAAQRGGALVDNPAAPTTPTLDDPRLVEAARWFQALAYRDEVLAPSALDMSGFTDGEALYCNHQAAMWIANDSAVWVHLNCNVNLGIAPVPVEGRPATFYTFYGHAIPKSSAHPEAAWDWLSFATRQPYFWTGIPARRSLLQQVTLDKYAQYPEAQTALRQAYAETMSAYAYADDLLLGVAPWGDVLQRLYAHALRQSWTTREDPAGPLAQAQAGAQAYLACLGEAAADSAQALTCETQTGVPSWFTIMGLRE